MPYKMGEWGDSCEISRENHSNNFDCPFCGGKRDAEAKDIVGLAPKGRYDRHEMRVIFTRCVNCQMVYWGHFPTVSLDTIAYLSDIWPEERTE